MPRAIPHWLLPVGLIVAGSAIVTTTTLLAIEKLRVRRQASDLTVIVNVDPTLADDLLNMRLDLEEKTFYITASTGGVFVNVTSDLPTRYNREATLRAVADRIYAELIANQPSGSTSLDEGVRQTIYGNVLYLAEGVL